ncbi:hypothetical protein BDP27DRAFT_899574 [Rhodocollybia butyracea]|uniref:Uncharacterized protein n=1 Tax=Rhodocollybia butyracea TaxID=206335 RepID=A0A9P5PKU4_9AGAR|nr:hypothetical protein BDP27DRAFT_899574 [Rhodocollybia butyracea]
MRGNSKEIAGHIIPIIAIISLVSPFCTYSENPMTSFATYNRNSNLPFYSILSYFRDLNAAFVGKRTRKSSVDRCTMYVTRPGMKGLMGSEREVSVYENNLVITVAIGGLPLTLVPPLSFAILSSNFRRNLDRLLRYFLRQ